MAPLAVNIAAYLAHPNFTATRMKCVSNVGSWRVQCLFTFDERRNLDVMGSGQFVAPYEVSSF